MTNFRLIPYFVSVEELKNSEFLIWIVCYSASVTDEELQNVEYMYKTIVNLKDISEIYGSEVQKVESYFKGDDDVYYHASNSHIVQCPFIVRLRKGI